MCDVLFNLYGSLLPVQLHKQSLNAMLYMTDWLIIIFQVNNYNIITNT